MTTSQLGSRLTVAYPALEKNTGNTLVFFSRAAFLIPWYSSQGQHFSCQSLLKVSLPL
jgi:hypothetical protein